MFINVRLYNGKHMKVDEFKEREEFSEPKLPWMVRLGNWFDKKREEVENDRRGTDEPL